MPQYSVAEARDRLADIFEEALGGERITITSDGVPVLELQPTRDRRSNDIARVLDEIAERAARLPSLGERPEDIIRQMRDREPGDDYP